MRVLHIFYGRDFVGGASYSMSTLAVELNQRQGIEVVAVVPWTHKHDMKRYLEQNGVTTFETSIASQMERAYENRLGSKARFRIRKIGKQLARIIADGKIDRIINKLSIDAVHIGGAVIDCGAAVAIKNNIPIIWHLREYGDLDWGLYYLDSKRALYELGCAKACIAVSNSVARYYLARQSKLPIHTIYNGIVREEEICSTRPVRSSREGLRIGFFGGIKREKGTFDLLSSLVLLREQGLNVSLDIYGNYNKTDLGVYEATLEDSKLENAVSYLGWKKIDLSTYQKYDLTVVGSSCEAFGRVTAESQLARVLVVGSNSGGTKELLSNDRGLLYQPGDCASLAQQIKLAYDRPDVVGNIIENAYCFACNQFTIEKYVNNVAAVYRDIGLLS